jgi:hypothetical protein
VAANEQKCQRSEQQRNVPVLPILFGVLVLSLLAGIVVISPADILVSRVVGLGVAAGIITLAWVDNRADARSKECSWRALADRTGLTYHDHGVLAGHTVAVSGTYRARTVHLSTTKQGKGQVQSTRIELRIANQGEVSLRLRGPFNRNAATLDRVTSNLFETSEAQQFGSDQRFFVRSKPVHLATALLADKPLWSRLLALKPLVSIECDEMTLIFETLGVIRDVEYLTMLVDLLSDVADTIEQTSLRTAASS